MSDIKNDKALLEYISKRCGIESTGIYNGLHALSEWRCRRGHGIWAADVTSIANGEWCPVCRSAPIRAALEDLTGGALVRHPASHSASALDPQMGFSVSTSCRNGHTVVVLEKQLRARLFADPEMRSFCEKCDRAADISRARRALAAHIMAHTDLIPPLAAIAAEYLQDGQALMYALAPQPRPAPVSAVLEWLAGESPETWARCAPSIPPPMFVATTPREKIAGVLWGCTPTDAPRQIAALAFPNWDGYDPAPSDSALVYPPWATDCPRSSDEAFIEFGSFMAEILTVKTGAKRLLDLMFHLWGAASRGETIAALPWAGAPAEQHLAYHVWSKLSIWLAFDQCSQGGGDCDSVRCSNPAAHLFERPPVIGVGRINPPKINAILANLCSEFKEVAADGTTFYRLYRTKLLSQSPSRIYEIAQTVCGRLNADKRTLRIVET